jgi:hypothetical protein
MAGGWIADRCSALRHWPALHSAAGLLPLALTACAALDRSPPVDVTAVAPTAETAVGSAAVAAWPEVPSCGELVRTLAAWDARDVRNLDPMTAPVVVASLGADPLPVRADLPIPEVASAAVAASPCAILVGAAVALPAAADSAAERRTVHSAYPTGTKRRRNPEHQALERELSATRRGAETDVDILSTGDPLLDLIGTVAGGVIGGIGAAAKRSDIRAVETALADTPAFIEDPILTPYRYELIELEAERRLAVPVALYDRGLGATLETTVTLAERRRFAVGDGRHPKDVESGHATDTTPITTAELAAWRRAKPPIATSMLLTHLAAVEPAAVTEQASLPTLMARLGAPEPLVATAAAQHQTSATGDADGIAMPTELLAAVDAILEAPEPSAGPASLAAGTTAPPQQGSVVRVGAAEQAGFYVTAEHVVVPAAALGHSSLITVRYPDGVRAHGLVEIVDEKLGLALVYLPRTGAALPLHPARSAAPATTGEPGMPWRADAAVIGLFVTDPETAGPRWIDSPTLDRFVGKLQRL